MIPPAQSTDSPVSGDRTLEDESSRAPRFDVCVIGAGAAGLVLTDLLSRDPKLRVCLLEAGPDRFTDRKEPFFVRSLHKTHAGVNDGRVTAFGGATNTWGGGLIRLSAADFEALEGRPDTAWPISYESIVPHYEAVESLFGFAVSPESVMIDRDAVRVRRRDIPVLPFRSKNFAHRFGPSLRARPNVTILCNANIVGFHPAPEGGLSHLDVEVGGQHGEAPQRIAATTYVVAAGVVNTILLARKIFQACGRTDEANRTGNYFHDHISFPIARLYPKSHFKFSRRFGYRFERGLLVGEHFDIECKGAGGPGGFLHFAFDMSESSILRPVRDVLNAIQRRTLRPERWPSLRDLASLVYGLPRLGFFRYILRRLYLDPGTRILATLDLEQIPHREWILKREPNDGDCSVSWDVSGEDSAFAARYIPICNEILAKLQGEAAFRVEPMTPDPIAAPAAFHEHLRRFAVDTLHSCGGLRMGTAPDALVDPDLRLSGVPNVHALGTAVFPRVGTSNPTLTILALAHRLTQLIGNAPQESPPTVAGQGHQLSG